MSVVVEGHLKGLFKGFTYPGTVFEFVSGQRWRQIQIGSTHHYSQTPSATVTKMHAGRYMLHVHGVDEAVEVEPVALGLSAARQSGRVNENV